jgi:peptidoglycan/xylan/chitin deacetylase (PgdA/CDA1 family)
MLCITFDNFGCGSQLPPCPFPEIVPVDEWRRYNEIGLELGHPRILQLLKQIGVKTTFFCEGYSAVLHPDQMKRWHDDGHEIALHGWKHEMWSNLASEAQEEDLVAQGGAAIRDLLGEAPQGFRPPGLKINPWSDDVFARHDIRYVAQTLDREKGHNDRLSGIGITYASEESPLVVSRLPLLECSDRLLDADLIAPAFGGLYGALDAEAAYDIFFYMASAHERATPDRPWTFIVHPFISGNRAWFGFEKFMRRLHAEFGAGAFKTAREVVFAVGHGDRHSH